MALLGPARQARHGESAHGGVRLGVVRHGRHGAISLGEARSGSAWQAWVGQAGCGKVRQARLGLAWYGAARFGVAGMARPGLTRHGAAGNLTKGVIMKEERELLTKMARQNNGVLQVDDVLEEAKDENSILHKHFEWDDSEAADLYRRQQARALIQRCRIEIIDVEPVEVRAFVSLPADRNSGGGYRLTTEVVNDATLKAELIDDIRRTISQWTKKLHLLDGDIADLLLKVEKRVTSTKSAETRVAA